MPSSRRPVRSLVLLLVTLLAVPLTALLGATPAHAAPVVATGTVYDGLGDPLSGVLVRALTAPAYTSGTVTDTTDASGEYAVALEPGTYRLEYTKAGHEPALYDGTSTVDVVVAGDGTVSTDGEPLADNLLADMTLTSTVQHAVTGSVQKAGGQAIAGITVDIFTTGDTDTPRDTATTNGSGAYSLEVPNGIYLVRFTDPGDTYLTTWYDGNGDPTEVTVTGDLALTTVTLATPPPASEFPIAGHVVDANGEGVNGVSVTVVGIGGSDDGGTTSTATVGEDVGTYSVSVLPGTYRVTFAKTGYTTTTYGPVGTPATVTVGGTGTLSVAPAEDLTGNRLNDLVLPSTAFQVTSTVQAVSNDAPINGITVRAFPHGTTDVAEVVDTATTAGAGSYTLDLPVGTYDLEYVDNVVAAPTYSTTTLTKVKVAQGGALSVDDVSVGALPVVKLAVSSADTPHPVTGAVLDANGAAIDGLTVAAAPQGDTPVGNAVSMTTGADGGLGEHGRYRLMLKPGSYEVTVSGTGWATTPYVHTGTQTALISVALNGTVLVNGTEVVGGDLEDTLVPGTTKHTLSGSVTDQASAGLVGITVKAFTEDDLVNAVATTTSGANGVWSLAGSSGLVVGSYVIELSGAAGGSTYDKTYVGGATPTPVEMAQGGVAKIAGVTVPSNTLAAVKMTVASTDTPHPVSGEVVDANGDPLSGVTVTPTGGASTATTGTNTEGAYTLQLKPGTYQLAYAKAGFTGTSYPSSVTVQLDGTVLAGSTPVTEGLELVTLAQATGTTAISGRVTSSGTPVAGLTVEVFTEGDLTPAGLARPAVTTAGDGTWTVTGLKIGAYLVRFTDNVADATTYVQTYFGGTTSATAKLVKVGQTNVTVDEVPQVGGALGDTTVTAADPTTTFPVSGEVSDAGGDPLAGVTVSVLTGPSATPVVTGADGLYTIQLKAGTYRLSYAKSGFTTSGYPGSGETAVDIVVTSGGTVTAGGTAVADGILDPVALEQTAGTTTISGKATKASDSSGLAGVLVELFPEGDFSLESRVASMTTAAGGAWSFANVRIGTYAVRFTASGYSQTYYGGDTPQTAKIVKVGQSSVTVDEVPKLNGALGDTPLVVAGADSIYHLLGDVSDANSEAVVGALVTATALGGGAATTTATTDEDGAYDLSLKAGVNGTYKVKVEKAGFTTAEYLNLDGTAPAVITVTSSGFKIDGEALEGNVLDTVSLVSSSTVPLGGTVETTAGAPIAGITVQALVVDSDTVAATATTNGSGGFSLNLRVGTYNIRYRDNVAAAPTYLEAFYTGSGSTAVDVKVSAGGGITDAEAGTTITSLGVVELGVADSSTRYDLKGLVYDETYESFDGVTVVILPATVTDEARKVAEGTTGADEISGEEHGFYRIKVPAGKYWVKFRKAGYATRYLTNYDDPGPVTVTVAGNGAVTAPGLELISNQLEDVQMLLPAPTLVTAPKLDKKPTVGQTVTTTIGKWNPDPQQFAGWQDYVTIDWYIDGKLDEDNYAGYYSQKYKVPAEAAGHKLSYRITIDDPSEAASRSPIVWTSAPVAVPAMKAKLTASYKKGALSVVVKVDGVKKPTGTITVLDGKKKIGKVKLTAKSKGTAVLVLKKLKPGKHKLLIKYSGGGGVLPAKLKYKIKV